MEPLYILWGIIIGVAVAAPIGPVNIICLQRTLKLGIAAGLITGLGAAIGDAIFSAIAAFGLSVLETAFLQQGWWLRAAGGVIMAVFAVYIWRADPHLDDEAATVKAGNGAPLRSALATFLLTITNPITILGFAGIFAAGGFSNMGIANATLLTNGFFMIGGVFAGSVIWWLILCGSASHFRDRISDATLRLIDHGTAIVMAGFSAAAFGSLIF